jgi:hypothetical protein
MLVKPQDLDFRGQKFAIIISGFPGIGKTTLGLSAPNPLLIDLDKGISRVKATHRKISSQVNTYEELLADIKNSDLKSFETLVIDTGGELLEFIKPYVASKNEKYAQKDGNLTLKGYGAAGQEFSRFIHLVKSMDKHIVIIFHAKEGKDGENTRLRIDVDGQSKDNIWKSIDIGGFIEMNGKNRTIGFSNCERYFAKGTHGVSGVYDIPELKDDTPNDFLTKLIETMRNEIITESEEANKVKETYATAMEMANDIAEATTVEEINSFIERIKNTTHALTSEKELKFKLNNKAKELNLIFDKGVKAYVANNSKPAE